MPFRKLLSAFIICLLLTLPIQGSALTLQDPRPAAAGTGTPGRTVPEDKWQELTRDDDFYYKDKREYKKTAKRQQQRNTPPPKRQPGVIEKLFRFLGSKTGKIVIWSVFFLILAYVVFRVVIGEKSFLFGRRSKVLAPQQEAAEVEEDLMEVNWQKKLDASVQSGDLRMAIRYTYMWLLQLLQQKELIHYRIDKTNYDYLGELSESQHRQAFRQLTRMYEYSWYGHYPTTREGYEDFAAQFLTVKKQIDKA